MQGDFALRLLLNYRLSFKKLVGQPYFFTNAELERAVGTTLYAMGFGFACSLNDYTVSNNFGSTWVSSSAGGVSFYGSTVTSYSAPDKSLAKKMFQYFKKLSNKTDNFSLGAWLYMAEQSYFFAFPIFTRKNQILKYNLIGDPSMPVYGYTDPWLSPRKNEMEQESIGELSESVVKQAMIYDVSGRLLKVVVENLSQETQSLPHGVYVIQTIYENDDVKTSKFVKL